MAKSRQEIDNCIVKQPDDHKEEPQTSSISNLKPCNERNFNWVSKNRVFDVEKSSLGPENEAGESSSGENKGGEGLYEREIEGGERNFELSKDGVDDVIRRLEELQFEAQEVELSQEQIKTNDQAQQDELLAMESIYKDNIHHLENHQGLRSFQIDIHIELSGAYPVSAKLKTDNHSNSKLSDSSNDELVYSFEVEYLSPITLTCLLPISYPSDCPPCFTISVEWLDESRIAKLCSMLDLYWNEQPGQEILYQWVEWLHSCSLPYLGLDEQLNLGPYNVEGSVSDRRAFSGIISPDIDIPLMQHYNEERQHENFLSHYHECCICFSEYAGTEFFRLPCNHFFCLKCMTTYAEMLVKEGTVNKLHCPETKCGGMIPPGLIKRLLGDEKYERWETLTLQKTLDAMPDVVYCPRCETACIEDNGHHAQCSNCFFSFCSLCREQRHVGSACATPEMKLKFLKERQKAFHLKDKQRIKEQNMMNDLLSMKEALRDSKQCPSCKTAISKNGGCNHMTCSQCGKDFCYGCSRERKGCICHLPQQQVLHQERAYARQVLSQFQAQIVASGARLCPVCKQLNPKVGNNNHICCWACQCHFCYLCRKTVRRSYEHYGPKGCKQHSEDR